MGTPALAYSVQDRSVLLPHYKRLFVEPLLPLLPRRLAPNTITHAGHVLALGALLLLLATRSRDRGWPFFVVAALINLYNWCDNVDGSHARRTNQCSATGEYLDHGLDLLSATYVACITVVTLGAPPIWSVAAAVVVPATAAIIYWEQAETGVFQLGLFNQVESIAALTALLVVRGVWGAPIVDAHLGPISIRVLLLGATFATATLDIVRSASRVAGRRGRLAPFVAPAAFGIALLLAAVTGALGTLAAIVTGAAVFVFHGIRQLTLRVHGRRPRVEPGILVAAALLGGLVVYHELGGTVGATIDWIAATLTTAYFGSLAFARAVEGHRAVGRLDREADADAA